MNLLKVFKAKTHARRDSKIPLVGVAMMACSLQIAFPLFGQTTFFSDDFESYATDANVTSAGWVIFDTPAAIEASTWTSAVPVV